MVHFRTGQWGLGRSQLFDGAILVSRSNGTEQDDGEIVVPEKFSFIFPKEGKYSELEFAGIAKPNIDNAEYDLEKETGLHHGSSDSWQWSNCNIIEHSIQYESCWTMLVKISLACRSMLIKATHSGYKSYYIKVRSKDVTGVMHKLAFYHDEPELQQDLLAGRALLNAVYLVILYNDPRTIELLEFFQ